MKASVYIACMLASAVPLLLPATFAGAEQPGQESVYAEIKAIRTEVIRGFCVGLYGAHSDDFTNNTTTDAVLEFVPWTTNESARIVVPREPEYAYQAELFDSNGIVMPKKRLGKMAGSRFFKFDASPSKQGIPIRPLTARRIGEVTGSLSLFRAEDLFQIEKAGKYTLRVRFQILTFPRTGPRRGQHTNDLIRFPPLDYPLIKKEPSEQAKRELGKAQSSP